MGTIDAVRKSAKSEKAVLYSREVGIELDKRMPVIVQAMVTKKQNVGVVYSKFPCPGDIAKVIREDVSSKERYIDAVPRKIGEDGLVYVDRGKPIVISKDYYNHGENKQEVLADLSIELEREFGYPIILEFATFEPNTSEEKFRINMLQARKLTKLSQAERFEMPELQEEGLIATTYDLNGVGDFTGESYVISREYGTGGVEAPGMVKFDKSHKEGYVLVAPYLQFYATYLDELTPNKKAVVAYTDLGHHHDMEVSRKKGILYVNARNSLTMGFYAADHFEERAPIETGDIVRVVSDGERGFVFKIPTGD